MIKMLLKRDKLKESSVASAPDEFAKHLNDSENAIQSCEVVRRADGRHLIISMGRLKAGDALHIAPDSGGIEYGYIFGTVSPPKRRYKTTSSTLDSLDQIDSPIRKACGLDGKKPAPIFVKKGFYSIYMGVGFRRSEDAENYACRIFIDSM